MCLWKTKQKANIPKPIREAFEQLGEAVIQAALASGNNMSTPLLSEIYNNIEGRKQQAIAWLSERLSAQKCRDNIQMGLEVAILFFVFIEALPILWHWLHKLTAP